MACKGSMKRPRERCMTWNFSGWGGQHTHSLVLKSPLLLNSFSLPVNNDAGPLNSCLVLRRRLTSLQGDDIPALSQQSKQWQRTSPLLPWTSGA